MKLDEKLHRATHGRHSDEDGEPVKENLQKYVLFKTLVSISGRDDVLRWPWTRWRSSMTLDDLKAFPKPRSKDDRRTHRSVRTKSKKKQQRTTLERPWRSHVEWRKHHRGRVPPLKSNVRLEHSFLSLEINESSGQPVLNAPPCARIPTIGACTFFFFIYIFFFSRRSERRKQSCFFDSRKTRVSLVSFVRDSPLLPVREQKLKRSMTRREFLENWSQTFLFSNLQLVL